MKQPPLFSFKLVNKGEYHIGYNSLLKQSYFQNNPCANSFTLYNILGVE